MSSAADHSFRVRARVSLLPPEQGGRDAPLIGPFRPNHAFFGPGEDMMMGQIELPEGYKLYPGESVETDVNFIPSDRLAPHLRPGCEWTLNEGLRPIGHAIVLEVLA